jgi:hypothetical protein
LACPADLPHDQAEGVHSELRVLVARLLEALADLLVGLAAGMQSGHDDRSAAAHRHLAVQQRRAELRKLGLEHR